MRTTIDRAGHLVVPKTLRDRVGLGNGGVVEVVERDGVLEIHPVPADIELRDGDDGPVADPVGHLPSLTDEHVRSTLERQRR